MVKILYFAALWLPCVAFLHEENLYDMDFTSLSNVGQRIKMECAIFLKDFAKSTREFNSCAVKHAKPLRFCEKCVQQYSGLLNPAKFNDSHCVDDLVRSERFQIVMRVYDFQTALWDAAHCEKCYKPRPDIHSTWNQTADTREFFHNLFLVQECINNHTRTITNGTFNRSKLCGECHDYMENLTKIYKKILVQTNGENEDLLCVDIMSAMNDTRKDWKNVYKCMKDGERRYYDLLVTLVVFLSTFFFYVGVRRHEKYKMKVYTRSSRIKKEVNYDSE